MASLNAAIVTMMLVSVLLAGGVTVFPPKQKSGKWAYIVAFLVVSILNYGLTQRKESDADRVHRLEIWKLRQDNSDIKKELAFQKGESASTSSTLQQLKKMAEHGATKEDMLAIVKVMIAGQEPNARLYARGMTLASTLMTLGPDFDMHMRGLQDDADNDRVQAKGPEGRARAQQVNDGRKRRATAEYLKELQPLLVEARELQPQLLKRFPGIPPRPSPAVDSLLRTGRPYDGATARDLGEYFRALSLPLGRQ